MGILRGLRGMCVKYLKANVCFEAIFTVGINHVIEKSGYEN